MFLFAVLFRSLSTDFVACKFVAGKVWLGGLHCDRENLKINLISHSSVGLCQFGFNIKHAAFATCFVYMLTCFVRLFGEFFLIFIFTLCRFFVHTSFVWFG